MEEILMFLMEYKFQVLIGIIVIFILAKIISVNNYIIKLKNKVKQSRASIDVYLNERFDLIPNLVECVKSYMEHENDLLENIAQERNNYINNNKKDLKSAIDLDAKCNQIIAVAENYPELKANEQFISLQNTLLKVEDQLQAARRLYNGDVTSYNTKISTFPINIIAFIFHHKQEKLFEIDANKRDNVEVKI